MPKNIAIKNLKFRLLTSYNIKKLDIAVRDLSINAHNKTTLGEDVQINQAQPVLKKPKLEETKPTPSNNTSSQKKPTNVIPQKTEKPLTPNIFAKNQTTTPPAKKEVKKVSDIKKPNPTKKQETKVVEPQKIVTEDCDDEECYYGTPVEDKNEPEQEKEKEKAEENVVEKDSQSNMKIEIPPEKSKQSQNDEDAAKMTLEIPQEKTKTAQSEAPLEESQQNNVENIAPEGEKFEMVKKKRRVKKTIEELNAKGQLGKKKIE